MNIAIFGASGHIGKNIIYYLKDEPGIKMFCFSRTTEKVENIISSTGAKNCFSKTYSEFSKIQYHAIINCIGIGDPAILRKAQDEIFILTEYYDNLILDCLKKNKSIVYINLSSGAVYGTDFRKPVDISSKTSIEVNNITTGDHYRIAKLNSEVKHRSLSDLNIIDLRIFGFFSRFIDLKKEFLLCEIITCIRDKKEFVTGTDNIFRDYIHPLDFVKIIKKCITSENINQPFDISSKAPISKFEILGFYREHYNLRFRTEPEAEFSSITGNKVNYYSTSNNLDIIKFKPEYSSAECIEMETNELSKLFS